MDGSGQDEMENERTTRSPRRFPNPQDCRLPSLHRKVKIFGADSAKGAFLIRRLASYRQIRLGSIKED